MHPRSSNCTQFVHKETMYGGISQGEYWGHISCGFFYLILIFEALIIFMMGNVCQGLKVGRLPGIREGKYAGLVNLKICTVYWVNKKIRQ